MNNEDAKKVWDYIDANDIIKEGGFDNPNFVYLVQISGDNFNHQVLCFDWNERDLRVELSWCFNTDGFNPRKNQPLFHTTYYVGKAGLIVTRTAIERPCNPY